jgi:hypothetical protein
MKIINQTENELVLKDGSASNIVFGIVFLLIGLAIGYSGYNSGSKAVWVGVALFVIGLLIALLSSTIGIDFNKASGQFTYRKKNLIGGKTTTYNFTDVFRVETRKQWQTENTSRGAGNTRISMPREVLVSQSVIVFKDGRELPVDHQKKNSQGMSGIIGSASVLMGGQSKEISIANQVATFLGVPFQEVAPPPGGIGINIGPNIKL